MISRGLALWISIGLLQGCALFRGPTDIGGAPPNRAQLSAWQAHLNQLRDVDQFILRGRVASGALGFKASLRWKQQADGTFSLRLLGPFGSGATSISGRPDRVTVRRGKGRAITTTSPERWLEKNVGAPVPIAGLRWWILGVPAPDSPHHIVLDPETGRASSIIQNGWSLEFQEYQSVPPLMLPARIRATRGDTSLLVLADQWSEIGSEKVHEFETTLPIFPAANQKRG